MKILLKDFRCWKDLTLDFPQGKITLLKGKSGSGKTTVLQALYWCLYGKLRLVTPNHNKNAKTCVSIETNDIKIERHKNPCRLIVTYKEILYEGDVAQSIINTLFGDQEVWISSCYIGQGCRNNFLTTNNEGKMSLLNNIAFHEEDPIAFVEKINSKLKDLNTDMSVLSAIYANELNTYNSFTSTIDFSNTSNDDVDTMKKYVKSLQEEYIIKQKQKQDRENVLFLNASIASQLKQVTLQLESIKIPDNFIYTYKKELYKFINIVERRDQLKELLKKI
jgi:DNA repair exonuclease SbcCD ATPase subunit